MQKYELYLWCIRDAKNGAFLPERRHRVSLYLLTYISWSVFIFAWVSHFLDGGCKPWGQLLGFTQSYVSYKTGPVAINNTQKNLAFLVFYRPHLGQLP